MLDAVSVHTISADTQDQESESASGRKNGYRIISNYATLKMNQ